MQLSHSSTNLDAILPISAESIVFVFYTQDHMDFPLGPKGVQLFVSLIDYWKLPSMINERQNLELIKVKWLQGKLWTSEAADA